MLLASLWYHVPKSIPLESTTWKIYSWSSFHTLETSRCACIYLRCGLMKRREWDIEKIWGVWLDFRRCCEAFKFSLHKNLQISVWILRAKIPRFCLVSYSTFTINITGVNFVLFCVYIMIIFIVSFCLFSSEGVMINRIYLGLCCVSFDLPRACSNAQTH